MPAATKGRTQPLDVPFSLPVPFARKPARQNASHPAVEAPPVPSRPPAKPASAVPAEPLKPKRRRLSKAFDRPLDKLLQPKSVITPIKSKKLEKSAVRDEFTLTKVERDRLLVFKTQLAEQGIKVRKGDLIRVGLMLAMSIPPAKLKSVLDRLPPVK